MNFRDEALRLVRDNGCRDLCEVGVWRGDLSRVLAPHARTLVLVDPWSALWNNFGDADYRCTMGGPLRQQLELNLMHDLVVRDLPQALVLRMPSEEAAKHVPDWSLDFVFIDAVHLFGYCMRDLAIWKPKLRPGGILAGDDYCGPVKAAVDAMFGAEVQNNNNVWWVRT